MRIHLDRAGKRFGREWIFRELTFTFEEGRHYAVTGPNGSGKSTLLRMLAGHLSPSKGKVVFSTQGQPLDIDAVYARVAWAAPYIELIEEFTLVEALRFHQRFKPFLQGMGPQEAAAQLDLVRARDKQIRHFSSGMKQRLKLGLALLSDVSLVLLDEPTTNLDEAGTAWYHELVARFGSKRTIVVASNVAADYAFCESTLHILNYKSPPARRRPLSRKRAHT